MKLDSKRIIPQIWTITLLFYLLRTIAEPLKYLLIISFGVLIFSFLLYIIKDYKKNSLVRFLLVTKEFQILGLFLTLGIIVSPQIEILSLKGLINFLGITTFFLIYFEYKNQINLTRFFKGWIFLTLAIGALGILKWLNLILELNLKYFSVFYRYGSSLVSDYNFYACYFNISFTIYLYAIYKNIAQNKLIANQSILLLFFANILLTGSRRGIIIFTILLLYAIFYLLKKRKERHTPFYTNLCVFNTFIFSLLLIFVSLFPFRSKIIQDPSSKTKITASVYRYSTLIVPKITYGLLVDKLWPKSAAYEIRQPDWGKYATFNNDDDDTVNNHYKKQINDYWLGLESKKNRQNFIYNGDFVYGLQFWKHFASDSIEHKIIDTKYGRAIRVSRFEGTGYWPLSYKGRELIYYKGVRYTFKFKYRVVKGNGIPFKIGWWINEGEGFRNNLPYKIRELDNEWVEFTGSYEFRNDQARLQTFMNSQHANSVVDFADIELTCNDTVNRPKYTDQLMMLEGRNLFYNSNFEYGLKFWGSFTPDSVIHELIDTKYGKALRVTRNEGVGYWPLIYQGRDIYYHKDLPYYFRFKFRVVKGVKTPFNIGWWVEGEGRKQYDLSKEIFPIDGEWYLCIAKTSFDKDYYGKITNFMNSQKANTIIDFADIELISTDSSNRFMFADEMIDEIRIQEAARMNVLLESEERKLFSQRISRWKYALELWKTEYQWTDRIFGGGFDYLDKFGRKFYPDEERIDYPHNPIISAFLYSGIVGGSFYIYFLILSFYYYWKYKKHHMLFFILFIITFVFVFISSDSHFNVPIFAMLSVVPFVTRYFVNEKEKNIRVNI